jgi:GNAT superfamily N-acetyltransferase
VDANQMTKSKAEPADGSDLSPTPQSVEPVPSEARPEVGLRVRRATLADAHAIAEIAVLGWQVGYRGILPDDFLDGLAVASREIAWRSILESDPEGMAPAWIAERDGRAVGFVSSGPPRDEDVPLPAAEVFALYVLPTAWRQGLGRLLLTTAVDYWLSRRSATLTLWVLEDNARARTFYEATGWLPDGARQPLEMGAFSVAEIRYRRSASG